MKPGKAGGGKVPQLKADARNDEGKGDWPRHTSTPQRVRASTYFGGFGVNQGLRRTCVEWTVDKLKENYSKKEASFSSARSSNSPKEVCNFGKSGEKGKKQYGSEGFGRRAPGKPLGGGVKSITGMGPILGGAVRQDDYESLDGWDFAHQVYRVGQRRVERWPHKP
jgi:hypothetical protein